MNRDDLQVEYIEKISKVQFLNKNIVLKEQEELNTSFIDKERILYESQEEYKQEVIRVTIKKEDGRELNAEIPLKKLNHIKVIIPNVSFEKNKLVKTIIINNVNYYIYINNKGHLCITNKLNDIFKIKQEMYRFITKKNIYFWGIITNTTNKDNKIENVYIGNKLYGKIVRPFKKWKLRHFAIIKVKIEDIANMDKIHNKVCIGDDKGNEIELMLTHKFIKGMKYFCKKRCKKKIVLLRSTINGKNYMLTQVPFEKEYGLECTIKNNIAKLIHSIWKLKHINLMYEKESNKANESGFYMFEKIAERENKIKSKSATYFVIDKNSKDYKRIKDKYGKKIIEKYTLRHYIYIYASKYFISSELSNHVINPRIYIRSLNKVISSKPLIFLQHGIMFAKPVENPAAKGFYKKNSATDIYKSVICSDLEAEQFYKMGYTNDDLLKTGLPKFDISYIKKDANKIMFMPTYRYWEEAFIFDKEKIKETTYFKLYMKVIKEFEKNNLLNRLIISCHPKFAEALAESMPKYANLIEEDINKGLENSKIFITDFSSASYDAHYRGAYIIYNWEEKEYLIKNYKAVPALNEDNCDGVPTYNIEELITEVKKAIKNDYIMDEKYQKRYQKINEFSDGKNGDRLIKELEKLNII